MPKAKPKEDPCIDRLATLFLEHPAWTEAARHLDQNAESAVFFSHRPGEPWQLVRRRGKTLLRSGRPADPDFVFRFTPFSADRLCAVKGDVGDFAVELFSLMLEVDPEKRVGFRICASFPRLAARGYVTLLLSAGPKLIRFGVAHGVATLSELRRLVQSLRKQAPQAFEAQSGAAGRDPASKRSAR